MTYALGSWRVRRIGYGAMQLAGDGVFGPPRDRDEALRVLRAAVDGGVNHIDTAQYYGPGTVNELIREALHPYPDDLAIVSKVAAGPGTDAAELRRDIEANLATLGTGRLAAVNLRTTDQLADKRFDAQLATLVKARDEGLIDGVGLSNVSRQQLRRAVDQTEIVCVQNLFNVADRRAEDVLDDCLARDIAFVPFCPLGWPRDKLLANEVLASTAARLSATPAQVALAWLLAQGDHVAPIPGTKRRSRLEENAAAATLMLSAEDLAELDALPEATGARY